MILVIVAHADDEVLGAGGTIAKYTESGETVIVVIFSFGEGSKPFYKNELIKKIRIKESEKVGTFLGVERTIILGIPDLKINSKDKGLIERVNHIILKYKPSKIFTHSSSDPHKDHRAVYTVVLEATRDLTYTVYTFGVWNPIYIRDTNVPRLYVDVSQTFEKKLKALKLFESQKLSIYQLLPNVFLKAKLGGWANHCRYAEVFYKLK